MGSLDEQQGIDTTPSGVAELEHAMIRERVMASLSWAKADGIPS
jgi:hypothetical protein